MTIERIPNTQSKPTKLPTCKHCGFKGHSSFLCLKRKKKTIATKKRIKPVGKISKALSKQSHEWRKENPPNHQGFYECYICGKWITPEELNVEHTKSKARHPEHRFNKELLKPACSDCNAAKGSKDN